MSNRVTGRALRMTTTGPTGASTVTWAGEVSKWALVPSALDAPTFDDVAGGVSDWLLSVDIKADMTDGSAWRFLSENAGAALVFVVNPLGAAAAATNTPDLTFTAYAVRRPGLSAESIPGRGKPVTVTVEFELDGEPVIDDGA